MSINASVEAVRAAYTAAERCAGAVPSLVNAATRGDDLSGAVRHLSNALDMADRDLRPLLQFIRDARPETDPVTWCGEPRPSAHAAAFAVAMNLACTVRNAIKEHLRAAGHGHGWPLPDAVVRAESGTIAKAVLQKFGGDTFHYDWQALSARLDLETGKAAQAAAALDGPAGKRRYAAEAAEARTPPAPPAQPLLKRLLQDLDNEFAAKHKLSPEQMATYSAWAAAVGEAMLPSIDRLGRWENEARHWYLILVGDDAPHRRRRNPDSFAVERNLWERVHPDDPEAVEWELAKRIAEDAREADKHCWGPDWCYLKQALAAHCDVTSRQMDKMSWEEIAAALKHAVERRRAGIAAEAAGENERSFMELAIQEARKSVGEDGRDHPKVGAVVVKDGTVVASAHRGEQGEGDHAEYTALERKLPNETIAGATVYTTLEPCTTRNHPKLPCARRLIERKVKRVVIGMLDPNPDICGKGARLLQEHNIEIALFPKELMDILEELNRDFTRAQSQAAKGEMPDSVDRADLGTREPAVALPPAAPVAGPHSGLLRFDLPTVFRCAVELAEAVASLLPSEWQSLPMDIEGPTSPHFERWREWHRRQNRIEEESARLKRALGAMGPLTARDRMAECADRKDVVHSPKWDSFGRKFSDTAHDRPVRLSLLKLATAAIDLSGFATWRERQWNMREQGLRLLEWGLAQLWAGLRGEERSSVQDRLPRTHKAIGWPLDPTAAPRSYNGPEEIPLEYQYRTVSPGEGFIACYRGYLDDVQQADNDQRQRHQDKFLRQATLAQFAELAERTLHTIRAMATAEADTPDVWSDHYLKAFYPLICLRRAKEVRPIADWPDAALAQRGLLADAAGPLLVWIGGVPGARDTLKPADAEKAFENFTRATGRLREMIAPPETGRQPPPQPSAPLPDGPFGTDGFRYRSVDVRFGRAAKQRSLVLALWDTENHRPRDPRPVQDVLDEVYGEGHDTEDAAFRQLCVDTRGRFERATMPLTIESLQGQVQLTPRPL